MLTLSSIMHLIDGACQDGLRSEVKGVFDLTLSDHLLSEVIRTVFIVLFSDFFL